MRQRGSVRESGDVRQRGAAAEVEGRQRGTVLEARQARQTHAVAQLQHSQARVSLKRLEARQRFAVADLEVSVSDFGSGVDPEDRMRIFKRYSRGMNTNDAPGTGIVLAVVSELLKLIGARVEVVDPAAGVGACFRITVPGVVSKV